MKKKRRSRKKYEMIKVHITIELNIKLNKLNWSILYLKIGMDGNKKENKRELQWAEAERMEITMIVNNFMLHAAWNGKIINKNWEIIEKK